MKRARSKNRPVSPGPIRLALAGLLAAQPVAAAPRSSPGLLRLALAGLLAAGPIVAAPALAQALPTGYLVWSKGVAGDPASRKVYRMTLPGKSDVVALTSGEDVEPQVSPDGNWVAYAKAKLAGGSDYHNFKLWKLYVVSIHGAGGGRQEIKIDDDGAWPSWGQAGELYYNQPDGAHTRIIRATLDERGQVVSKETVFETRSAFASIAEVNEAFVAPDGSWFAARSRGAPSVNGVGAYRISPPERFTLARAGEIGCMPYVAPSGTWGLIAGATEGIRWGHAPHVADRKEDQLLVPPLTSGHKAYHPGISSDGKWVLAGMGTEQDHNSGAYDIYIHQLDAQAMQVSSAEAIATGGFNGWPHVWVGEPGPPPPPQPQVVELYPSSYTIGPGEAVTLTWSTFDADEVTLDGETVAPEGTRDLSPTATTTYTVTARSSAAPGEADEASCTVTLNATPQPVVIERFELERPTIEQGQSVVISWSVRNATTLDLAGARVAPTGVLEVSPLETTTYVLTARGHQGPVTAEVTVRVTGISSGLLPDKGGFVCGFAGPAGTGTSMGAPAAPPLALLGLALLGLLVRRRR